MEREGKMERQSMHNERGVTLVELMIALVIAAITLAGVYRVFISQTRTYAVQDQVVEVQQSVRSAMEIMLRDLRMTGFDDDNPTSTYSVPTAITTIGSNTIAVNYEYYNRTLNQYERHQVTYAVNGSSQLTRTLNVTAAVVPATNPSTEILLDNVNALNFTYGIDANSDRIMDDQNGDGIINAADYVAAGGVGSATVVAIRVALTGGPNPTNVDVAKIVSPRTLVSAVTLRNVCLR
jgi:prepilin-type N-terminal cleavage/methylation domain-containing protein